MGASLIPSGQFCAATATSSTLLERFHFRSIRYNSYFLTDNHISRACNHNPCRESSLFVLKKKHFCSYKSPSVSFCCKSNNWADHWNVPKHNSLPKQPRSIVTYRKGGTVGCYGAGRGEGSSTMDRIVEKLKKFGYIDDANEKREKSVERRIEKGSIEDIFYVEEGMLPNARGGFSEESPLGAEGVFRSKDGVVRFPWEKQRDKEEKERDAERNKSRTSLAELTLPQSEFRRLRNLAVRMKNKTKIGGGGVTQAVVDTIHEKWKTSETVKLKIEGAPALNMKRMHEILERKTGGLVIWRSGTSVSLYRGVSYEVPLVKLNKQRYTRTEHPLSSLSTSPDEISKASSEPVPYKGVNASIESTSLENNDAESFHEVNYEDEVDKLLDGLGPRYTDWPGDDPLPVDADMLPGIVPGYKPPFRILPYGVRSSLNHKEGTVLRRLARVLPPHFALGRSRQLQGLAVAIIKLWERSSIAKVALKRGVQLTTSERMAEDIKKLTGGILLSRNKDFLVFYRGKNFLSRDVTEALLERERLAKALQDGEELARQRATALISPGIDAAEQPGTAGTLGETLDANSKWGRRLDDHEKEKVLREVEVVRHANLLRKLERKLSFAERKLEKAEKALAKVEEFLKPAERQADPESITDEERFMLRKLGLRMKAFLLLGRRGIFDGTVENMHLHWKYRELVKILVKAKTFDEVKKVALALEAESGGILVSVDRISKGYAIVVFRGKDYQRPSTLRPKNLLTKRKALARSIELQRREALYNHISTLQRNVDKFRSQIEQMDLVKDKGHEKLYETLDDAYSTEDDDDGEDEGDETFLPTYDSESDGADESSCTIQNFHPDTNSPCDEFGMDHALPEPVTQNENESEHYLMTSKVNLDHKLRSIQ